VSALAQRAAALAAALVALGALFGATEWAVRRLAPELPPILFIELGERLAGSDNAAFTELIEPDPETGWRLAPDVVRPDDDRLFPGRVSNSQGLREESDVPLAKPPGELRILFLGASNTFGLKLRREATLAAQLERRLAARFPSHPVECINAGVPGYSAYQGLQYLGRDGLAFAPDLVIATFGWNDEAAFGPWSDIELAERARAARPPILASSRLATLVWRLAHPLESPPEGAPPRPRLTPDELARVLGWMRDDVLAADADLLVNVSGAGWNLLPNEPLGARTTYQIAQLDFAEGQRLRDGATPMAFDGVSPLQELLRDMRPHEILPDAFHATALVNERVADALARHLAPWVEWRLAQRALR